MCRQIRVKLANVKFYESMFRGRKVVSLRADKQKKDDQTDRHTDEGPQRFQYELFDVANAPRKVLYFAT
jgi:hypothetical protein